MSIEEIVRPYGIIYAAINTVTQKYYIGKTVRKLAQRKSAHLSVSKRESTNRFYNSIRKHGADAFSWFVVDYADNEQDLCDKEDQWMWATNSLHPMFGYNLKTDSFGAVKGRKMPKEFGEAIAERKRGVPRTPECRAKLSKALKGRKLPLETRAKMREAKKGTRPSEFCMEKMRLFTPTEEQKALRRLRRHSEESRQKMSLVRKDYYKEHPMSEEQLKLFRERFRKSNGKPVLCVETGEVFDSLVAAAEKYGPASGNTYGLLQCLKKRCLTYKKLHWKYKAKEDSTLAIT